MEPGGRGAADARAALERDASPPEPPERAPAGEDLQALLARATRRLAAETGAERVLVWEGAGPEIPEGASPALGEGASPEVPAGGSASIRQGDSPVSRKGDSLVSREGDSPVSRQGDSPVSRKGASPATREGASPVDHAVPAVRAAFLGAGTLSAPTAAELASLADHSGAVDLGGLAEAIAERHGVAAAAAVPGLAGGTAWVVLAGGGALAPGSVRPRVLAALAAAAERLAAPIAAAAAAERLARLDAEVRRLDRLAALGGLVAEIVHEIRNPLVSVKTFLQLLPERGHEPEFQKGFLGLAAEELRRVERLLDLVLHHARPGADDSAEAEVGPSAESVAQLVAHRAAERGVAVRIECGEGTEGTPAVAVSPDALRQVLLNLVLNAIDASPEGGAVHIAASHRSGAVELAVEDSGPGVAAADHERVFQPFFSGKPGRPGGLGLAISRRIADEARGDLTVEDAPGGGARFVLRLPVAARAG